VLLPLGFVFLVLQDFADSASGALVQRVVSVIFSVAFLLFSVVLVRAGSGMFGGAFYARRFVLAGRAGRALVLLLLAVQPVALLLDVQGYHFTAAALQSRVLATIVILVLAKLVIDTGLLGLTIAGQRTAMAREQEARDETAAADAPAEVDLEKMNASAIALLQVFALGLTAAALMSLWSQFFTALTILDSVDLWQFESAVEGKTVLGSVTLFDLLGAVLLFGASLILARGLPALLGILLYSFVTRKGVLFAIQTVISYTAVAVGLFLSLQLLGFGWGKLQWMAAGLSVGLGFGLQEIFANFFAGLIMLFERPVRIGDVITLGEYSGTIQRIRMRATTITDFDNREIIVPNKMFVTERLINWTLSSSVVRMSFDVGVSYASDPRVVREILLELIAADPRVLKDPPPNVVFREFGASSLNFRCFGHVEDISLRFQVQSDLHMRITEVFRERGIEISYPQMDLHLRSVDPVAGARLAGGAA
jgi:potassium efflux system protein